ncbi:MAG: LD-carboxypeptidase, partial [Rhodoferax sp.]|uniref:LD-carboxypeptidase n=1 Tax=Rhodoferax sp. TaxID=50421 RepID=UPI0014017AF1
MNNHIYIYSPSGAVRDKAAFKRGVARLKSLGHEVEIDEAALTSHLRFAGDDETRLAAIHRAAASGAAVALISRGGYGLSRILPGIRYKAVAKAIDQGMRFVGISDFTAFQSAVLAKTGRVTWAGPALCEGFGVGGKPDAASEPVARPNPVPDDIMEACFDDLVQG